MGVSSEHDFKEEQAHGVTMGHGATTRQMVARESVGSVHCSIWTEVHGTSSKIYFSLAEYKFLITYGWLRAVPMPQPPNVVNSRLSFIIVHIPDSLPMGIKKN